MTKYVKIISLLFCTCCLFNNSVSAQDEYTQDTLVTVETTGDEEAVEGTNAEGSSSQNYERFYMDEKGLEELRRKKEFQYPDMDSADAAENNNYLNQKRPEPIEIKRSPFDGSVIIWLVVIAAVILIVLQLVGVNMRQLFSPARVVSKSEQDGESENIHEIPFESAIQQAILARNYSLATRLMYLQSLKLLSDKNLISWHENKTNWQYVWELKNEKLRSSFRTITYIFEYVRYGHMPISEEKFVTVKESFANFKMNVI